jgi:ABC-2 type transport system ATP-binding protein
MRIGYLPEQPPLYLDMTVKEYLGFIYDLKKVKFPKEPHINEICRLVKIEDVKGRLIKNLSKGYKQRVGLAQALVGNPDVLILDEPTVGLDPKQIIEIRSLITELGKNHTVILSSHILSEIQAVCERIIIINKGKIIADERTEDITRTIEDGYHYQVKIVGPAREIRSTLEKINGVKSVTETGERDADAFAFLVESERGVDVRKPLFNACARMNWPILGLMPVGTDLESIFIRLVDRSEGIEPVRKERRPRAH